ncbi:PTS system, beta-glucoside-specific IIB component [Lachnospiraceae bacterium KM106-2]|nr:PTS system, beta-glucoside-specific IIB component [Lachnospiraceae bacterium KM106-2]
MKYEQLAKDILSNVGGSENVEGLIHCYTRLRFTLKDQTKANKEAIENLKGVSAVMISGGQFQVVIGNQVSEVYDAVVSVGNIKVAKEDNSEEKAEKKGSFVDVISGIFLPVIGTMCACGMIKGLVALLVFFGAFTDKSTTYTILQGIGDSVFYYLPVFLGFTAAKRFGGNPFTGMVMGASMVYPNILALATAKPIMTLFGGTIFKASATATLAGIPVVAMDYNSTVFPVIIAVFFAVKLEKAINKKTPAVLKSFFAPFITLLIMLPLTFIVIGPIVSILSNLVANGLQSFFGFNVIIASMVFGIVWQILIMFGLHGMIFPLIFMNLGMYGYDFIFPGAFAASFTQVAACVALAMLEKNEEKKSISISSAISALFGITEPAIYGVTLPNKKAFIASVISSGIGGLIIGIFNVKMYVMGGMGIVGIINYINPKTGSIEGTPYAVLAAVVSMVICFTITYIWNKKQPTKTVTITTEKNTIYAPIKGQVRPLDQCSDATFASGVMGQGVMIIPEEGVVKAPSNGRIETIFPTGHAVGMTTEDGIELLIHVGLDTVELNGKHFTALKKDGDTVVAGEPIIQFDIRGIKKDGYRTETPVIITNADDYSKVTPVSFDLLDAMKPLMKVENK